MDKTQSRYFHPKIHFANCCSYALPLAALRKGLTVEILGLPALQQAGILRKSGTKLTDIFSISDGKQTHLFNKSLLQSTSATTRALSLDKFAFKQLMIGLELEHSNAVTVKPTEQERALACAETIGYPVVLKPVFGSMGKGVFVNLTDAKALLQALQKSKGTLLLEKHVEGRELRLYVLGGEVIAEIERRAPQIVGDGVTSIRNLVRAYSQNRKRQKMPRVTDFQDFEQILQTQRLNMDSILGQGESLPLTAKIGRSSGGLVHCKSHGFSVRVRDCAKKIAAQVKDLPFFALDIIINHSELCILEINARPQISSMLFPDSGEPVDFPCLYLDYLFGQRDDEFPQAQYYRAEYRRQLEQQPQLRSVKVTPMSNAIAEIRDRDKIQQAELSFTLGNIHQVLLKREAWRHGLRVASFKDQHGRKKWSVQSDQRAILFRSHMPASTPHRIRLLTNDKYLTKEALMAAGIRVPHGRLFTKQNGHLAADFLESFQGRPLVVKPLEGSGGNGVSTGICDFPSLQRAIASVQHEQFIVEEQIQGEDYRLMVINGRFVAAIHRVPAHVIGDGHATIAELVAAKNKLRANNPYLRKSPININEEAVRRMSKAGYQLDSVLPAGTKVVLSGVANLSAGGDSIDVTDEVHPSFIALAERVNTAFAQLAFSGVDILTPDIRVEATSENHAFIEVNANCDIAMHHFPVQGQSRNIAGMIIKSLFPEANSELSLTKTFLISGKVQRVGYRKWLQRTAFSLGLVGSVENLANGRVQATLQGSEMALSEVLKRMMQGPEKAAVKNIRCETCPPITTDLIQILPSRP